MIIEPEPRVKIKSLREGALLCSRSGSDGAALVVEVAVAQLAAVPCGPQELRATTARSRQRKRMRDTAVNRAIRQLAKPSDVRRKNRAGDWMSLPCSGGT